MTKLLVVLLIGLTFEAIGVVLLKQGLTALGHHPVTNTATALRLVKQGATSPAILGGVFFEALFFGCLLWLMSQADISFVWPMTGLSFVFATLAARWFLKEQVSTARWAGVCLIVIGAALVTWSEKSRPKTPTHMSALQTAVRQK
jgi:drug/metabolite transporter (DMT)-like permease